MRWKLPRLDVRARAAGTIAVAALLGRLASPSPPARTIDGVAQLLGDSVKGHVRPGDFVWERNEGVLEEALRGRNVLFLASEQPGGPRDLYRARVRLSLEGQPLEVSSVVDLTSTPLGDDVALTADGPFATRFVAFASTAYGSIASLTLLDLDGDGGVVGAQGVLESALGELTNLFETGTLRGIGRTVFSFETPPPSVRLGFDKAGFVISLPEGPTATFDLAKGALAPGSEEANLAVQRLPHLRKSPVLWAVDTVRAVVGPGPIAVLEDMAFGARDELRRAEYHLTSSTPVAKHEDAPPPSPPLDASAAGDDGGYWPPQRLPSIWESPEAGEGEWVPVHHPFLKPLPGVVGKAPAYFYQTWLKPDAKRPYSKVLVVAMDMRRLEIGMEGGVEDPKPLTGTKSFGRIPRDPDVLDRVVGAFNGAFKTTHGAYGMMVDKRVLLPPKPGAATVVVTEDDRVGMGSWPQSDAIPDDLRSFRQNLDALVEDGKFNPTGRTQWGFQLPGTSVMTQRSGICVTKPGHFLYLWGDDVSANTLGKAMVQAGCAYGMHLDMNPKHTGFVFAAIRDVRKKDYDAKLLTSEMEILPERYIEWSPKDFFYVMLRKNPEPTASDGSLRWKPDSGVQPAPSWLPGVFEATAQEQGVDVTVLGIDQGRATYRVRPGREDSADAKDLAETEKTIVAALGLGNGRRPRPMGLVVDGKTIAPFRGKNGYLVVTTSGDVQIVAQEPSDATKLAAVAELPLLSQNGNLTIAVESQGPLRKRSAACVLPWGRLAIATSTATSDAANATVLQKAGCKAVVALDRGSHDASWIDRAGKKASGAARGEETTLYAIGTPMRPRAFVWKP